MNRFISIFCLFFLLVLFNSAYSQYSNATLVGVVTDTGGKPLELVNVALFDYPIGTTTNKKGEYLLRIPSQREIVVGFSALGYKLQKIAFNLEPDKLYEQNIILEAYSQQLDEVVITQKEQNSGNIVRIDPKVMGKVPAIGSASVEGLIKTMPGVTSGNELSNQYSVRGGSYDENLVYVNDIEVYRPYLIRAGQQEGLSFVNTDMVSSIEFSAGGFDAKYGDKMSSVLDIKYNRPLEFSAKVSAGLLGANAQIENISKNQKFTYNMGLRYKTFKYLLGSLDEKGAYNPAFVDYQGYLTYTINPKFSVAFLGTVSLNKYEFVPKSRRTQSGVWNDQRSLSVSYEGQEVDRFQTLTGALSFEYKPVKNAYLKFIASGYTTSEQETYDIIGYYFLNEVQNIGSEEQEDTSTNVGLGYYHEHGRNYLEASVVSLVHRGAVKTSNNFVQWGIDAKREQVNDRMSEWEYRDSAGYSIPYSPQNVNLYYASRTPEYTHNEMRYTAFVQNSFSFPVGFGDVMITGGARAHYWTFTDNLSISPRISTALATGFNHDILLRASAGMYHQPPFYREIKDLNGNINYNIQTPQSLNMVAGVDYSFISWNRPFRLTFETYYKSMKNLIPYQIENVRIRYLSNQISDGYAIGADLKVNGEFVSGTQSWVSLSLMKTEEDIRGDGHGFIRRPTDQRFKFSMFFQDYLPGLPHYQMHMTGHFITGAPFGMPRSERYLQTAQMRSYKRVDIGFTRAVVSNGRNLTKVDFFNNFQDLDFSIEVFNLLDIENVSSYFFVADVYNNYYPVPNKLTGITFNLKISAAF